MTDQEPSIEERIVEAGRWMAKERPNSSFFAWPDRQIAESGICRIFAEAALAESGFPLTGIVSREADPPDCEALDADGRRIAIELTELVDGAANALAKQGGGVQVIACWDRAKFEREVRARLARKDSVKLLGGPYAEYWVIVHCDEPLVSVASVEDWLSELGFGPFNQISRAYLLLSYDPTRGGYPYFRLVG